MRGKKLAGIQVRYEEEKEKKMARNSSRFDPGKAFLFFGKCVCAENAEWGVRDGPKFGSNLHERVFFAFGFSKGFYQIPLRAKKHVHYHISQKIPPPPTKKAHLSALLC